MTAYLENLNQNSDCHLAGIESRILDAQWAKDVKPQALTDFETQARRLRYQAIGQAAYEDRISSILLAHHSDDQAETMLMRLAMHRRPQALLEAVRDMPECFGIYGVNKSGSPINYCTNKSMKPDLAMGFEAGGLKIIRPLLHFDKKRLIATCQHMGIEWFHDHTNDDKSLTLRNASRYLLNTNALPTALQKDNLLLLQSYVIEENEKRKLRIDCLFAKLKLHLILPSGVVRVVLPKLFSSLYDRLKSPSMEMMRYEGAMLLRRIANLVTPLPTIDLRTLGSNLSRVFSDLDIAQVPSRGQDPTSATFTADGVIFYQDHRSLKDTSKAIWVLARQPFRRHHSLPSNAILSFSACERHRYGPKVGDTYQENRNSSSFRLWDGRFWIRIKNNTNRSLICRPLTERDMSPVNSALHGNKSAHDLIKRAAPGSLKFVLPVLADTEGEVHQLPSLSLNLSKESKDGLIQSDMRYKNIDLGNHVPLEAINLAS